MSFPRPTAATALSRRFSRRRRRPENFRDLPRSAGRSCRGRVSSPPRGKTAVIETARSSGLTLVEGRRDILRADTSGLGRQIEAALEHWPENVHRPRRLGDQRLGGGDGGRPGSVFSTARDAFSRPGRPRSPNCGRSRRLGLTPVSGRLVSKSWPTSTILFGPHGAATVFAPRKERTPGPSAAGGNRLAVRRHRRSGLGKKIPRSSWGGRAGGLGFGTAAFLGAVICRGSKRSSRRPD